MKPKFSQVTVQLVGQDGNAFTVLGLVQKAMHKAGISKADIEAFTTEATAGDYNHLLATVVRTVEVE